METTGPVGTATLNKGVLTLNHLHADKLKFPDQTFVQYGLTNRLQLGFGYLWPFGSAQGKQNGGVWRPLANYAVVTETRSRPSLTAGLLYDSLQGGRDGFSLSAGKSLPKALPRPLSIYAGAAKITSERRWRFVAGGNLKLAQWVTLSVQYNGLAPTYGVSVKVATVKQLPVSFSLLAVNGDSFGTVSAIRAGLIEK